MHEQSVQKVADATAQIAIQETRLGKMAVMPEMEHPSGLLSELIVELNRLAADVAARSYSPYSRFRVGAALLLSVGDDGEDKIVTGCNVENASFRLTTCAEQSAIATAVAMYGPGIKILAVAVANLNGAASMPCGACRQTILEFSTDETWVFYPGEKGVAQEATLAALIPAAFRLEQG